MVNHGLVVGAIFLIVALLWERSGSEDLTRLGGLATRAPVLASLFLIITLANLAMPGTGNFMGEFYILIGVFQSKIVFAFVASIGVVLAAYYAIRLFQRTMHNRRTENADSREIGLRDALVLAPLVACIVALALYPGFILGRTDTSVKNTIAQTCAQFASTGGNRVLSVASRCPGDPFDKSGPPPLQTATAGQPELNVIK
jgi:NADH-quinone oxidoreductase subunit M